ncbi:MBL fold metallo-hydrolase [Georgenia subflava]|uniref:MBL fold metallo-hydrolase n=1 Tax=Georgenia subflava TaxID=1622177 RepID=A0A6N7EK60_9MICO|nr:MBL fold metallo-hydrolase [Georgenia subflava]MPV37478.1 MBL fold metallo-hydrolase [Georgenia subflava]
MRALVEVAPGVHVATATTYTTTSTVLVAGDGACLVVDPALTAGEVGALAAALAHRGWHPVAGFVTHAHWDHLLWHRDLGSVPRWATADAARYAREHLPRLRVEAAADVPGTAPTTDRLAALASGATAVPWSGPPVEVVEHPSHAAGHAALVAGPVLIAGDMLSDVEVPLLDLDVADPVAAHHEGLDRLASVLVRPSTTMLVPGHGHVTDRAGALERLAADRRYVDAVAAGRDLDTAEEPRLADHWVRDEHERQRGFLRHGRA